MTLAGILIPDLSVINILRLTGNLELINGFIKHPGAT